MSCASMLFINKIVCVCVPCVLGRFSCVRLLCTLWTVASQAPHPWDSSGKTVCFSYLLIDFWVFPAAHRLSAVAAGRVCSLVVVCRLLSHCVASRVAEHKLEGTWAPAVMECGLTSCGSRALECGLTTCGTQAELPCGMWIFSDQDWTCVSCIGRWTTGAQEKSDSIHLKSPKTTHRLL